MQAVTITQITPPELETLINNALNKAFTNFVQLHHSQPTDTWFDLKGLCEYLPDKPAKQTIYGNIQNIPHHKKGKTLLFLRSEIDSWLKSGRIKTTSEIEADADAYLSNNKKVRN